MGYGGELRGGAGDVEIVTDGVNVTLQVTWAPQLIFSWLSLSHFCREGGRQGESE